MDRSELDPPRRLPLRVIAADPGRIPTQYSDRNTLLVTFGFRCNLACTFCMVEDVLGVYEGVRPEALRAFLRDPRAMSGIRRVTFSGGEATLEETLPEYVRMARSAPGVEHVRVQTNGTRLGNAAYVASLVDAGVDEFFVSIHAPDSASCEEITKKKGAFRAVVRGLEQVAASSATLHTNTVICARNHRRLSDIVDVVMPHAPRTMDFWNLWPRLDKSDSHGDFVPVMDARPGLLAALERCVEGGATPIVKWFPHCLLGEYAGYHDDSQPTVLVEQTYWDEAPQFGCVYEGVCEHAPEPCAGLSFPYVERFGWEERVLRPARVVRAPRAAGRAGASSRVDRALRRLRLQTGMILSGWQLGAARIAGRGVVLTLASAAGLFEVSVLPRDVGRPVFGRTRRLDVCLTDQSVDEPAAVQPPLKTLLAHLRAVDGPS